MSRDSSRREFLTGRSAIRALADAQGELAEPLPSPGRGADNWLTQISREAMACEFEVLLDARKYPAGTDAAVEALDLVETLEAQLTVYRDTSEVSRLNQRAQGEAIVVEEGLFRLFLQAKELWAATQGAFDITGGALTKVWGFYRRQGRLPSDSEIAAALTKVGSQHLELNPADRSARFLVPDLEINLGAIGKGFTLDACADLLVRRGVSDFLIHGGNSSVLARGARSQETGVGSQEPVPAGLPWLVGLRHPLRPDERLAEFALCDQALGTSGSGSQFFHHQGKRYSHIIDPRTGRPAEQVLSATVVAPTAAEADALSTAFYVLGLSAAQDYCCQSPAISALLVTQQGAGIQLHPVNLPDENWRDLSA